METEKSGFGELLDAYIFNAEQKIHHQSHSPPKRRNTFTPPVLK